MTISKINIASFSVRHSSGLVLASMCLRVLLAQLDSMVVNLALKHIGAESSGDPAAVTHGLRMALLVGGVGELSGALIALCFVRAGALQGHAGAD